MRFELTDEQQMVQGLAREFAEQEVKPVAAECDREGRFPHATVKRMDINPLNEGHTLVISRAHAVTQRSSTSTPRTWR